MARYSHRNGGIGMNNLHFKRVLYGITLVEGKKKNSL